jgi:hypothetical protein
MTFVERRQRVTDTDSPLILLELTADSFPEPLRLVNDTVDCVSNGETYIGYPFGFKGPEDKNEGSPNVQLRIDNVGRGISEDLENLGPNEILMARIMLTDRADPNVIFRDYWMPLMSVQISGAVATATAGVDHFMRQQSVRLRFNQFTAPGLFL